jgi:hypothetical protein
MSQEFLDSIKQKELDAKCHLEILKSRKEIYSQVLPLKNFSNKILSQIIADYHDLVPITEKCLEMNLLKEETKDPNENRLYQLVKSNKTIKDHPLIKQFMQKNKISQEQAIFYLEMSNYGLETAQNFFNKS